MPGIIVGVDGSDESGKALGWAMREAALRHVPLTVVTVREPPVRLATQIYWGVHTFPDGGLSHEQMKQSVRVIRWQGGERSRPDGTWDHRERRDRARGTRTHQRLG